MALFTTNNIIVKLIIVFLLIILVSDNAYSQTKTQSYVYVKGRVKEDKKGLAGVSVEIYDGPSKSNAVTTESYGRFKYKLRFDKIYKIYYKKNGYVTKIIEFNTFIEEKDIMWEYEFDLRLFKMVDDLDISALKNPVAKVIYSEELGDFDFDVAYSKIMRGKLTKMTNQLKSLESKRYSTLIASADNNFRNKNYEKAIELYENALDVDPYADYPFNQIDKCEKLLKQPKVNEEDYAKVIKMADTEFNNKQYEKALALYENALDIDPYADYPDKQIDKCEKLLAGLENVDKNYATAIKSADKYLAAKKLEDAKTKYSEALSFKSNEQYPKDKILEINKLLSEQNNQADKKTQYDKLITEGDTYFTNKNYDNAKTKYQDALTVIPAQIYPKEKISEINTLLENLAAKSAKDEEYQKLITDADTYFNNKEYQSAKEKYGSAIKVKSNETYPKNRIKEIDKLVADIQDNENSYNKLISEADGLFNQKEYSNSKAKYNSALEIKQEQHPKDRIAEIDKLIADKAAADKTEADKLLAAKLAKEKLDGDYDKLIADADGSFKSKDYSIAKDKYNSALALKQEQYPKNKITEIDKLLADNAAAEKATADKLLAAKLAKEKLDTDYDKLILEADASFNSKEFDNAKTKYNSALALKQEQYPKDKIAEINKLVADNAAADKATAEKLLAAKLAKEKLDADYSKLITSADKLFTSSKLKDARVKYNEALALKQEQYPKDRITEIDKQLIALADEKTTKSNYDKLIVEADRYYKSKQYDNAKNKYELALQVIPGELYPKEKVNEINALLAEINNKAQKDEEYQTLISAADTDLDNREFTKSKESFTKASILKPEEAYPKNKIKEIDKLIADQAKEKELNSQYNKLISEADNLFNSKNYNDSKNKYNEALKIKIEQHPKDRIAEIDGLIADKAATDKAVADKLLAAKLAKEKLDADYDKLISEADGSLKSKDYSGAKTKYNEALKLKQEQYPKDKIAEIDGLIADKAASDKAAADKLLAAKLAKEKLDADYSKLISEADGSLKSKDYSGAKTKYNEALKLKQEQYPKDKIAEIDGLIADKTASDKAAADKLLAAKLAKEKLDADYAKLISEADGSLKSKDYSGAKTKYNEALKLKQEQYPKDKIAEIDGLIAEAKANKLAKEKLETNYNKLISTADGLLATKKYNDAKFKYNEALKLKQEQYPKDKIVEIDGLIAQAKKDKLDSDYKKLIADADKYLAVKEYNNAKDKYNAALKLKSEQYPKDKITEIDKLVADKAKQDAIDSKYNGLVADGNNLFKSQQLDQAKTKFQDALKVKSGESYPQSKITEIDKLIAQNKINKEYLVELKKADNLFNAKKYKEAKTAYSAASKVKPSENYPKQKMVEIQNILNGQVATSTKPKEEELKDITKLSSTQKKQYLNSLAKKYPEGKTVKEFTAKNGKKTTIVIMNSGGIAHEYRKIKQPWGDTNYFKDGQNISSSIFFNETN